MPSLIRTVPVSPADRVHLEQLIRTGSTPHRLVVRARLVLGAAAGESGNALAGRLGVSRPTVTLWLSRYEAEGVAGLVADRPRSGRPKRLTAVKAEQLVRVVTRTPAPDGGTHWSTRLVARATGWSQSTVSRTLRAHGLRPHRVKRFKLSTDPDFVVKLRDVVGLYLDPPKRAVVFSIDEKSQIQALNRTQPGLPLKRGRAGTMTHDYERHGTTTLFAALNVASGTVVHQCQPRHRDQEFLKFLAHVERSVPKGLALHVILDNYGTHRTPAVQRWLRRHRRVHFHFTPTSASWLNLVERFFSELTTRQIRRLAVTSVDELIAAIARYIATRNQHPTPFTWTATVRAILAKVNRAQHTLDSVH